MFNQIGGLNSVGGPLSDNQIGGESFIRHCGNDKLIYDFKSGSGTTVYDKSHCGNNGTFGVGTAAPTWRRNSLYFDGGDYVNCGKQASINDMTEITYVLQINPVVDSATIILIDKDAKKYIYLHTDNKLRGVIFGAVNANGYTETIISNVKKNIIITFSSIGDRKIYFYVDGTKVPNSTSNIAATLPLTSDANGDLYLASRAGTQYFYTGTMYSFRIFNKGLSGIECQQEYLANKFRGNN